LPAGFRAITATVGAFMILIAGLAVVAILGCCAAFTAVGVRLIERAHRPGGVFVPVSGGRLHVGHQIAAAQRDDADAL